MQFSFFSESARLDKLTKLGDPLAQLDTIVNWRIFTPVLDRAIPRAKGEKGGRPRARARAYPLPRSSAPMIASQSRLLPKISMFSSVASCARSVFAEQISLPKTTL